MTFRRTILAGFACGALALSFALTACGGGDDDGGDSGGSTSAGTGSDEQYVATMCKAFNEFGKDIDALLKDPKVLADQDKAADAFVKPMEALANKMAKAKPPKDAKAAHDNMVSLFRDGVADVKKNGINSTAFEDLEAPKLDEKVSDRLNKVAEKNKDCKEAEFDFSE